MRGKRSLEKKQDETDFYFALKEDELLEDTMKLVSVEGTPVLLIRQSGKIYVIDNRCPHLGCGFNGGTLEGKTIICPCHDWRFNLETGEYEDGKWLKLHSFEWKLKNGEILVKIYE
jgi:nitrite reductase/ring-hydroxylating ferredoxin subunit